MDLHGHGHEIQRIELGYLLNASVLSRDDAQLALSTEARSSSLRAMTISSGLAFAALVRGSSSFGAHLETAGYPSVPSPTNPSPGTAPYFDGGYSTQRYRTSTDNRFAGVQIESNFDGVRDTPSSRAAFATALVTALDSFLGSALPARKSP